MVLMLFPPEIQQAPGPDFRKVGKSLNTDTYSTRDQVFRGSLHSNCPFGEVYRWLYGRKFSFTANMVILFTSAVFSQIGALQVA